MNEFMRHEKEKVLNALDYLQDFNNSKQYQDNFKIVVEYIEDIIKLSEHYKNEAEQSLSSLKDMLTKMSKTISKLPQDHKRKVRKQ